MGDRSMETCLAEQLDVLRETVRLNGQCGSSLQDWYDDGANVAQLLSWPSQGPDGPRAVIYAWGYLEGAADALGLTVMEMLDAHGLSFDDAPTKRQKIRKIKR